MKNHIVAPSILAANYLQLEQEIQLVNESQADWIHVDVMDGVFVPNISFGQKMVRQLAKASKLPVDLHLMIVQPEKYIEQFRDCGAENITVHYEACPHLHRTIEQIKNSGARAGVAINPHTPIELLQDILENIDLVCVMAVNPGYGGQKFIYRSLDKVKRLKTMLETRNLHALIEIDGGVGLQNAEVCLQAGVRVLVAGSCVFTSKNPDQTIQKLKAIGSDTFIV